MNELSQIVLSPDPRLSQECAPIDAIDDEVRALAKRMLKIMYAADGCGLAGPQIGEMRQIVVIDVDYAGHGKKNPYVLINPRVVTADGPEREGSEGCLSFPGVSVRVSRPSHVVVQALNLAQSQANQNQYLVDQLRPCPQPAYITCNPWGANGYGGYGYGGCCNSGCGCN